jgi:hypothetical protein
MKRLAMKKPALFGSQGGSPRRVEDILRMKVARPRDLNQINKNFVKDESRTILI